MKIRDVGKNRCMPATEKQAELIVRLQNKGAPIPENDHGNPDNSMFESIENADKYIKKYGSYINGGLGYVYGDFGGNVNKEAGAGDWGGVYNH